MLKMMHIPGMYITIKINREHDTTVKEKCSSTKTIKLRLMKNYFTLL